MDEIKKNKYNKFTRLIMLISLNLTAAFLLSNINKTNLVKAQENVNEFEEEYDEDENNEDDDEDDVDYDDEEDYEVTDEDYFDYVEDVDDEEDYDDGFGAEIEKIYDDDDDEDISDAETAYGDDDDYEIDDEDFVDEDFISYGNFNNGFGFGSSSSSRNYYNNFSSYNNNYDEDFGNIDDDADFYSLSGNEDYDDYFNVGTTKRNPVNPTTLGMQPGTTPVFTTPVPNPQINPVITPQFKPITNPPLTPTTGLDSFYKVHKDKIEKFNKEINVLKHYIKTYRTANFNLLQNQMTPTDLLIDLDSKINVVANAIKQYEEKLENYYNRKTINKNEETSISNLQQQIENSIESYKITVNKELVSLRKAYSELYKKFNHDINALKGILDTEKDRTIINGYKIKNFLNNLNKNIKYMSDFLNTVKAYSDLYFDKITNELNNTPSFGNLMIPLTVADVEDLFSISQENDSNVQDYINNGLEKDEDKLEVKKIWQSTYVTPQDINDDEIDIKNILNQIENFIYYAQKIRPSLAIKTQNIDLEKDLLLVKQNLIDEKIDENAKNEAINKFKEISQFIKTEIDNVNAIARSLLQKVGPLYNIMKYIQTNGKAENFAAGTNFGDIKAELSTYINMVKSNVEPVADYVVLKEDDLLTFRIKGTQYDQTLLENAQTEFDKALVYFYNDLSKKIINDALKTKITEIESQQYGFEEIINAKANKKKFIKIEDENEDNSDKNSENDENNNNDFYSDKSIDQLEGLIKDDIFYLNNVRPNPLKVLDQSVIYANADNEIKEIIEKIDEYRANPADDKLNILRKEVGKIDKKTEIELNSIQSLSKELDYKTKIILQAFNYIFNKTNGLDYKGTNNKPIKNNVVVFKYLDGHSKIMEKYSNLDWDMITSLMSNKEKINDAIDFDEYMTNVTDAINMLQDITNNKLKSGYATKHIESLKKFLNNINNYNPNEGNDEEQEEEQKEEPKEEPKKKEEKIEEKKKGGPKKEEKKPLINIQNLKNRVAELKKYTDTYRPKTAGDAHQKLKDAVNKLEKYLDQVAVADQIDVNAVIDLENKVKKDVEEILKINENIETDLLRVKDAFDYLIDLTDVEFKGFTVKQFNNYKEKISTRVATIENKLKKYEEIRTKLKLNNVKFKTFKIDPDLIPDYIEDRNILNSWSADIHRTKNTNLVNQKDKDNIERLLKGEQPLKKEEPPKPKKVEKKPENPFKDPKLKKKIEKPEEKIDEKKKPKKEDPKPKKKIEKPGQPPVNPKNPVEAKVLDVATELKNMNAEERIKKLRLYNNNVRPLGKNFRSIKDLNGNINKLEHKFNRIKNARVGAIEDKDITELRDLIKAVEENVAKEKNLIMANSKKYEPIYGKLKTLFESIKNYKIEDFNPGVNKNVKGGFNAIIKDATTSINEIQGDLAALKPYKTIINMNLDKKIDNNDKFDSDLADKNIKAHNELNKIVSDNLKDVQKKAAVDKVMKDVTDLLGKIENSVL